VPGIGFQATQRLRWRYLFAIDGWATTRPRLLFSSPVKISHPETIHSVEKRDLDSPVLELSQ